MIILYAIPENDSRAVRLREMLSEEGIAHRYVGTDAAGHTLGELSPATIRQNHTLRRICRRILASFSTLPTSTTTKQRNSSTSSSTTALFSAIRCSPTQP